MLHNPLPFEKPNTVQELLQRLKETKSESEKHILDHIASTMVDAFFISINDNRMDATQIAELVALGNIENYSFRERIYFALKNGLKTLHRYHQTELWNGLIQFLEKCQNDEMLFQLAKSDCSSLLNTLFLDIHQDSTPTHTSRVLQHCYRYLDALSKGGVHFQSVADFRQFTYYQLLIKFSQHSDNNLQYEASRCLQSLHYLSFCAKKNLTIQSTHAQLSAQFSLKGKNEEKIIAVKKSIQVLDNEKRMRLAQYIVNGQLTRDVIEQEFPEMDLSLNDDKRKQFHKITGQEYQYDICHVMGELLTQLNDVEMAKFFKKLQPAEKTSQTVFKQLYLVDFLASKLGEGKLSSYGESIFHICTSPAFLPQARFRAMHLLIESTSQEARIVVHGLIERFKLLSSCGKKEQIASGVFTALTTGKLIPAFIHLIDDFKSGSDKRKEMIVESIIFLSRFSDTTFGKEILSIGEDIFKHMGDKKLPNLHSLIQVIEKETPSETSLLYMNSLLRRVLISREFNNYLEQHTKEQVAEQLEAPKVSSSNAGMYQPPKMAATSSSQSSTQNFSSRYRPGGLSE